MLTFFWLRLYDSLKNKNISVEICLGVFFFCDILVMRFAFNAIVVFSNSVFFGCYVETPERYTVFISWKQKKDLIWFLCLLVERNDVETNKDLGKCTFQFKIVLVFFIVGNCESSMTRGCSSHWKIWVERKSIDGICNIHCKNIMLKLGNH